MGSIMAKLYGMSSRRKALIWISSAVAICLIVDVLLGYLSYPEVGIQALVLPGQTVRLSVRSEKIGETAVRAGSLFSLENGWQIDSEDYPSEAPQPTGFLEVTVFSRGAWTIRMSEDREMTIFVISRAWWPPR